MLVVEPLLGTRAEVAITAASPGAATAIEQRVVDEVARLESVFTVYDTSSALHDLRRTGTTDVAALQTVVALADAWRERTGGAFHPGAQQLVDLWDRADGTDTPPAADALRRMAEHIRTADATSDLNVNAIAKGWIADRALRTTLDATPEATAGWLSLGGDVVHRGAGTVKVGIEDPARPYDNVAPLATIELSNEALATSGSARRWWTIGGRRYPKVLDPRTGRPVDRVASATVVAADGATADALATAAIVMDTDQTLALATEVGAECFLIASDGTSTSSSSRFRPS